MSVNKVILIGNVGSDPEIRQTSGGLKVANFSMATTERGYTAQNGTQVPERTEWHNITCWGGSATLVEGYVKKGSKLFVEGKIKTRSYDDNAGIKRYITEIHVEKIELLGSKPTTQQANNNQQYSQQPQPGPIPTGATGQDGDLPF